MIGLVARSRFPGGIPIPAGLTNAEAAERTREVMARRVPAIFEATFVRDNYAVRCDILVPESDGWRVIEVKGSGSPKPEYLEDIAFQVWLLKEDGVNVTGASLMHLNKEYVWEGGEYDSAQLFTLVDNLHEVEAKLGDIGERAVKFLSLWGLGSYPVTDGTPPHIDPGLRATCRGCDFREHCFGKAPKDHIFYLGLHHSRVKKLKERRITKIEQIPDDFVTDAKERLRFDAFVSRTPQVSPALADRLSEIRYPAHLIDFETLRPDLPAIPNSSPFELLAFQWSNHTVEGCPDDEYVKRGPQQGHDDFVYEGHGDPRPLFAQTLYNAIKDGGSILHYHTYEITVIKDLAVKGVPFAEELMGLTETRFIDLEKMVKECYADAQFGGQTSIKAVLPVVAPNLSYKTLSIRNGDQAQIEYLKALKGACSDEEARQIYGNLRQYCQLDTWAMVRILHVLARAANVSPAAN